MLPYLVILALQPRPCSDRLALTPTRSGTGSPFLSPTRNSPWCALSLAPTSNPPCPTRPSSTLTALRACPSLPHSIPAPCHPSRLASPLLATRHSSLATSSVLTLLKSHCSTKITR